ncbi:MAG: cysteine methyltransferase [Bacteroidetes bacterium RIFCSPLOWO2_02_FULL_36_8]|nr:MAG: cysteine methyltransferase [Bacteroidetes bacterium RIFCSPLOWO2_02_FULL_36_8]OFY71206.1 MAG: cysteine methyltransferase [Bacteroidetes bacterium RIFCSPLOWO2_12_FULL_37_12]
MKIQSKDKQFFRNPNIQPNFFQDVYDVVKLIPRGRVSTYGAIAKYLGTGKSARMVGWALNVCHSLKEVPAHRVVNRSGILTGKVHFSPPELMEKMLIKEGIKVKADTILNFEKLFWDPGKELGM